MCSLTKLRAWPRLLILALTALCLLLCAALLGATLLAPSPARADEWDGDQVIRKDRDKKDSADEDEELSADERREAYEEAADPEAAAAAKSKGKKGKGKSKGKSRSDKHNHDDLENDGASGGVDEYGSYFGLGDEEAGAQPSGGNVRYVEGQGYVRDDGVTEVSQQRGGTRAQADPDQAEAEQVWGPLWGVPADSPVMENYRPDHPMTPEEEEALRTGNKPGHGPDGQPLFSEGDSTEVIYGDEENLTPKQRKALARQRKAEEKARLKEEREAQLKAADEEADESDKDEDSADNSKTRRRSKQYNPEEW